MRKAGGNIGTRAAFEIIAVVCLWFFCLLPVRASEISDSLQEPLKGPKYTVNASPVCYGQKLGDSVLEGTAVDGDGGSIPGTFAWKEPEKTMQKIGDTLETVIFTPEEQPENPVFLNASVTVKQGIVEVKECPGVKSGKAVYDGDTPAEVLSLEGGLAVCVLSGEEGDTEETVAGNFIWKEPDQELRTGKQELEVKFEPLNKEKYQSAAALVEVEAAPRPVSLKLDLSDTVIKTDDEIFFTASVDKTDKLQKLEGSVHFFVEKEEVAESRFTDSGLKWTAKASWKTDVPGTFSVYALYIPENDRTAEARSPEKRWSAVVPLSSIMTEELPAGREGKLYQMSLETDASGKFPVTFSLADGSLPEGVMLEEGGELKGVPKQAGEFTFTVSALEGKKEVRREFHLHIEEKLIFSVSCRDIRYGEEVFAYAESLPEAQIQYSLTFEGRGETDYAVSEQPPVQPGTYRVKALIREPADYAGQEIFRNFTIRKAAPELTVTAQPSEWKGEGECTVFIRIQNPYNPEWKENLPEAITVSFDKEVEVSQPLQGGDGSYTIVFKAGQRTEKIRCSVLAGANDCYEQAEGYADVSVSAEKEDRNEQVSGNDGKDVQEKKEEPAKQRESESEPEPAVKTPQEAEAEFWQDVIFRIYDAQEMGDTVTINARGHGSMPDKVLDALRQHEKVTLALVWEGDMIVIEAGKAPAYDKAHANWTLAELSLQYPAVKADAQEPQKASQAAPESQEAADEKKNENGSQKDPDAAVKEKESEPEPESEESAAIEAEEETAPETEAFWELPEKTILTEKADGGGIDWFLVAACVCAGCGIIIVTIAVLAVACRKR